MLRNKKVVESRHYVWDLTAVVHDVEVKDKGPASVKTFLFEDERYVEPIAQRDDGEWRYILSDVNGAPLELVDGAGRSVVRFDRSVWGELSPKSGDASVTTPLRFSGQWADPETGLHYNRYRYYDPKTGRFIAPDPISLSGGLNFYQYAPNPVAWIDPMGWQHFTSVRGMNPAHARHSASGAGNRPVRYDSHINAESCPLERSRPHGTQRANVLLRRLAERPAERPLPAPRLAPAVPELSRRDDADGRRDGLHHHVQLGRASEQQLDHVHPDGRPCRQLPRGLRARATGRP